MKSIKMTSENGEINSQTGAEGDVPNAADKPAAKRRAPRKRAAADDVSAQSVGA